MGVRCVGRIGHVSFPEIRWPERSVELCDRGNITNA